MSRYPSPSTSPCEYYLFAIAILLKIFGKLLLKIRTFFVVSNDRIKNTSALSSYLQSQEFKMEQLYGGKPGLFCYIFIFY